MKRGIVCIVVIGFLLTINANVNAANYVTNGDAEDTASQLKGNVNGLKLFELDSTNEGWDVYDNIPGWRSGVNDAGIEVQYDGNQVNAHSPLLYLELDSHTSLENQDTNSSMIQDITFDGLGSYELSFWYRPRTSLPNDNDIFVYFTFNDPDVLNPVLIGSVSGIAGPTTGWEQYTYVLNIDNISSPWTLMLSAGGIDNTTGGFLDDIVIVALDSDNDGDPDNTDCNDSDPTIFTGAPEICGDGIDQDCDGADLTCPDDDNDGVPNSADLCPNTPAGETVDANGCSLSQIDADGDGYTADVDCDDNNSAINPGATDIPCDGIDQNCDGVDATDATCTDDDNDGVPNSADLCPNTPAGEQVDANGCSQSQLDDDNDGVTNDIDQCPNTPAGETVDANGCSQSQIDGDGDGYTADVDCDDTDNTINPGATDTPCDGIDQDCSGADAVDATCTDDDNDGVPNSNDHCPNTPAGESVDANGCSQSQLDDDNDGVTNDIDQCPNTPAGETVDANGCSQSQIDADGDGYTADVDCDDNNSTINPGATDIPCDGIDQNCDGVDATDATCTDDDNDGVPNSADLCPNTPAGEQVDANGCSQSQLDDDNDGVTNDIDQCPNTPAGETVDANGCSASQLNDPDVDDDGDGYTDNEGDCDDTNPDINPGALEIVGNSIDDDCDANTSDVEADAVYFPALYDGINDWSNYLTIQAENPSDTVNITYYFYDPTGTVWHVEPKVLTPNSRDTTTPNFAKFDLLQFTLFKGTAIVRANKPILGMTNTIGQNVDAFNIYEAPLPLRNLFFPAAFDNEAAQYKNIINIQNINPNPVNITLDLIDDALPTVTVNYQIPGYGEYENEIRNAFGGDFNGTIRVSADADVTGMLRYEKNKMLFDNVTLIVDAVNIYGSTGEKTQLYYPYIYDGFGEDPLLLDQSNFNHNFYATMNTSLTQNRSCSFELYPDSGDTGSGPYFTEGPISIPANDRHTTTPSWAMFGEYGHDFTGSMIATCDGNATAMINVITPQVEGLNFYQPCEPRVSLLFPQVYDNLDNYTNELHLQNPNNTQANVTLELFYTDGTPLGTDSQVIPPKGKYIVQPDSMNTNGVLPTNGFFIVTADLQITGVLVYKYGPIDVDIDPGPGIEMESYQSMTIYEAVK